MFVGCFQCHWSLRENMPSQRSTEMTGLLLNPAFILEGFLVGESHRPQPCNFVFLLPLPWPYMPNNLLTSQTVTSRVFKSDRHKSYLCRMKLVWKSRFLTRQHFELPTATQNFTLPAPLWIKGSAFGFFLPSLA